MRRALAALLCIALPCYAQSSDAPLADKPGASVKLEPGQAAPFRCQCLSEDENLRRGKRTAECEGTLDAAKSGNVLVPKPAFVALVVGLVVASAAVSAGVVYAVTPKAAP